VLFWVGEGITKKKAFENEDLEEQKLGSGLNVKSSDNSLIAIAPLNESG
jgi:hypothetical protein